MFSFLSQQPSEPWIVFPSIPNRFSEWLYEDTHWSVPHVIMPFLVYIYWRNVWGVLSLVFLWEVVESILVMAFNGYIIFVGENVVELIGDSMIGDVSMGILGIIMSYWFLRAFKYYTVEITPSTHSFTDKMLLKTYLKCIFQLFWIGLPNIIFKLYTPSGLISIGYLVFIINGFIAIRVSKTWNTIDGKSIFWTRESHGNVISKGKTLISESVTYTRKKFKYSYYCEFYYYISYFYLIFTSSLLFRYTHVFIMTTIHSILAIIILILYERFKKPNQYKYSNDTSKKPGKLTSVTITL